MGKRKRLAADAMKQERSEVAFAKLTNVPSSPRKMRLVADMIRGKEVFRALGILKFSNKEAAARVENFSVRPSPTGKQRTKQKPKPANSTSKQSSSTPHLCSNASVRLPKAAATVSANVPITSHSSSTPSNPHKTKS